MPAAAVQDHDETSAKPDRAFDFANLPKQG